MSDKRPQGFLRSVKRRTLWIGGVVGVLCIALLASLLMQAVTFARQGAATRSFGNNRGISSDTLTTAADYDGNGNSYSAQALQAAGVTPGKVLIVRGYRFSWPNTAPGQNDNYQANGQRIKVSALPQGGELALLGSATHGPSQGSLTLTYSDGSTQVTALRFSDWTLNGGNGRLLFHNGVVATMPYRNTPHGHEQVKTYLFLTIIATQAAKTLTSITLPAHVDHGQLHIFALGMIPAPTNASTPTPQPTATQVPVTPQPTATQGPLPPGGCSTPASCGFPNASNTGVPAGTKLTAEAGNISVTQDGAVISGVDLNGSFDVYANNVTIENCRIASTNWWGINLRQGYTGLKVLHCTITGVVGKGQDNGGEDYGVSNMGNGSVEVAFNDISEFGEAISMGHGYIHDNYIHDLQSFVNLDGQYEHTDDVISDGGDTQGLIVRHNTLLNQMTTQQGASASVGLFADTGPVSNSTVDDNWIAGGSYALYGGGSGATNIQVTNNVFSTQYWSGCGYYGPVAYWNAGGAGNVFSGNRFPDGTPVSPAS